MCELMENYARKHAKEYAEEAIKEATKEAAKEKSKEIAVNLWNGGLKDMQQIANATKLSLDEVKELLTDKPA